MPQQERPAPDPPHRLLPSWLGSTAQVSAVLLLVGLLVAALFVLLLRGRPHKASPLAQTEREQLLVNLREWMQADQQPLGHGEKS
jgi:hypothetical protein